MERSLTAKVSAWIFLFGSILFLIQAVASTLNMKSLSNFANIVSAILFIIGSAFFILSASLK